MSQSEKPDTVIGHHPCADGMAAMWALWKRWPDINFIQTSYGAPLPEQHLIDGKNILIVDFSYKRADLELLAIAAKSITILDHHLSAQRDLVDFAVGDLRNLMPLSVLADESCGHQPVKGLPIQAVFDMERSGAMLAWQYAHPNNAPPPLIQYVQDRDLWRWALPFSREINSFIGSYPLDVQAYEAAHVAMINDRTNWIIEAGRAVARDRAGIVKDMLEHTTRTMRIGGHDVPVANVYKVFASDAAGILAEEAVFGASYFDRSDGRREFSLRSRGDAAMDVSEIARAYGGGGHHRAAGFICAPGWSGEVVEEVSGLKVGGMAGSKIAVNLGDGAGARGGGPDHGAGDSGADHGSSGAGVGGASPPSDQG